MTAIPGEFRSAIGSGEFVDDADEHDAARVWTDVDVWRAKVSGNRWTKSAGAVHARVENSDLDARVTETSVVNDTRREDVGITHREPLCIAELVTCRWTGRQIVIVGRAAQREEVVARAGRVLLAPAAEDRVVARDVMVDAHVVTVHVRVFFAVRDEIAARTRKVRQRKRVDVIERKLREATAARTVAQVVAGNGRAVRREDRSNWRVYTAAAGEFVSTRRAWLQQLTEITEAHSRGRNRYRIWIAGAAKNRRAVALSVQREEEERTIATIEKRWRAFAEARQENWTTDG